MTSAPTHVNSEQASRDHRWALITLIGGVPLAWLVAGIWSLVIGTSDINGMPRVTGAQAVLLDAPGSLLLVGAAVVSLVYAARALRRQAHGSSWGLWASTFGVFITLLVTSTVAVDTLLGPEGDTWRWIVRAGSLVVAVAAGLLARTWAQRSLPDEADPHG